MILFIVAALLITPVFLAFYFDEHEKWYFYNLAIDAVLICDIVIWFFTGYYNPHTQVVILEPKVVARCAKCRLWKLRSVLLVTII